MSGLRERLEALIESTPELVTPEALEAHYRPIGLDPEEFASVCLEYFQGQRPAVNAAVSLAARMYELGYRAGSDGAVPRERIVEALRDAHRHDSAADAVEYVSELIGWSADEDEELA